MQGVASNKNALGYFGYAYYEPNKSRLKAVLIVNGNGKAIGPSFDNVINGSYEPLSRPIFIYVSEKAAQRPEVKEFVEYYHKEKGTLPKTYDAAGWDATHVLAQALEKAGADAGSEAIAAAIRAPYRGVIAQYNFAAADMTGIELGSYTYSKLIKGRFTRLAFKAGK